MLSEDWGAQMLLAQKAVRAMHADSSRLLLDLDRTLVGYKSVYGAIATVDLSRDIKRGNYMAYGLFRHWVHLSQRDTVIAVNVVFWEEEPLIEEPLFIAAKLLYSEALPLSYDVEKAWDPWSSYLYWTDQRKLNDISEVKAPEKRTDILRVASIGVPLSSVTSEAHGAAVLEKAKDFNFS